MKSKELRQWIIEFAKAPAYFEVIEAIDSRIESVIQQALEDYEDYMTDKISKEPGKVFDRKEIIKEFLKHLNS